MQDPSPVAPPSQAGTREWVGLSVLALPAFLCLTHGDMWRNNLMAGRAGQPAFLQPAVSYMWAEVDIAHMLCTGGIPDSFFTANGEIRSLPPDFWQYAIYAAVAYVRAAASRAGVPVRQACHDLGERQSQQAQ